MQLLDIGEGHNQTAIKKYCMDPAKRWAEADIWANDMAKLKAELDKAKVRAEMEVMHADFEYKAMNVEAKLYGWQVDLANMLKKGEGPDGRLTAAKAPKRKIGWVTDVEGGAGKNHMQRYLIAKYGAGFIGYAKVRLRTSRCFVLRHNTRISGRSTTSTTWCASKASAACGW